MRQGFFIVDCKEFMFDFREVDYQVHLSLITNDHYISLWK